MHIVEKKRFAYVIHSDLVNCWNTKHQVCVLPVYLVFRHSVQPVSPPHFFQIEIKFKQWFEVADFVRNLHWLIRNWNINIVFSDDILSVHEVLQEQVESRSRLLFQTGTDTPNQRIQQAIVKFVLNIRWYFAFDLLFLLLINLVLTWSERFHVTLNKLDHVVHQVRPLASAGELSIFPGELDADIDGVVEHFFEVIDDLLIDECRQVVAVRLNVNVMAKLFTFQEHHTASRDCSRWSLWKIIDLEHDCHLWF